MSAYWRPCVAPTDTRAVGLLAHLLASDVVRFARVGTGRSGVLVALMLALGF